MDGPILDKEKMLCTSAEIASQFRRSEVRLGDIVYALRGRLGDVRAITPELEGANLTQGTARISPALCVHSPYLLWALRNPDVVLRACAESKGTTFMEITLSDLRKIKIAVPSRSEQLEISSTLSDIDDHLMTLDLELTKKRNIKQAAMQELLTGKRRLPGFEGEWVEVVLGEHAKFFKGKGLPKSDLTPYGEYGCVHYGELFTLYNESIRETRSYTHKVDNLFVSAANDVLMPTSDVTPRGLAKASCICRNGIVIGGDILVIRPNPGAINGTFLSYLIRRDSAQILRLVTGSTVYHIYSGDMKRFAFRLPTVIEQEAIVELLDDLGAELESLEVSLEKARAIKQGMMQQLLTGKIRLR
jgi:type I restriction enzyme S subunit